MTVLRALYFDDLKEDRETYAGRLNTTKLIEVFTSLPPTDLNLESISGFKPQLVLIDYELTSQDPETGQHANYRGATLASAIRELVNDIPLVLLTRKSFLGWDSQKLIENFPVFDEVMDKGEIDANPQKAAQKLISLAKSFELMRCKEKNFSSLVKLIECLSIEEEAFIREAVPPMEKGVWQINKVSKWLQETLLKFPGVFLDSIHSATFLGINLESFLNPRVVELFENAKYKGIFYEDFPCWWKNRLLSQALELSIKHGLQGPIHRTFIQAFELEFGETLGKSRCIVSGGEPADAVCFIYKEPVMTSYSFIYRPDVRPIIMDEARVSLKAILETNEVEDEYLEVIDREIIEKMSERFYES